MFLEISLFTFLQHWLIDSFTHSYIYLFIYLFWSIYNSLHTLHREKEREYRVINIQSQRLNDSRCRECSNSPSLRCLVCIFSHVSTTWRHPKKTHINTYHMLESKQLHGFIHHFASGEDPNPRAPPRARCSSRPQEAFQVWINGPCRRSVVKTENCDWD